MRMAINLSIEPKIALCIITGLSDYGLRGSSFHSKGLLEYSSGSKSSDDNGSSLSYV